MVIEILTLYLACYFQWNILLTEKGCMLYYNLKLPVISGTYDVKFLLTKAKPKKKWHFLIGDWVWALFNCLNFLRKILRKCERGKSVKREKTRTFLKKDNGAKT